MKQSTQSGPSRRTAKRQTRVAESRKAKPVDSDDLEAILSHFPTSVRLSYGKAKGGPTMRDPGRPAERVVAMFQFSEKGFGFGEITIIQTAEGCFLDTEHMSRETVKRFLGMLIDGAISDTDTEPEKHLLYNRVAGRSCGAHCGVCYPVRGIKSKKKARR